MSEVNEDLAQLLAIVNQEEDEEDEEQLTEEELQQALSSPSLHQQAMDREADEESTECDDYDISGDTNLNQIDGRESGQTVADGQEVVGDGGQSVPKGQKATEYQFQMLDHHIFKGKHGKKLYKCDVCYAVYRHSFSLKRHFIRSHINYSYLCETDVTNCGINLIASASLQQWKQTTAQPLDTSQTDLPELYCCHSCVLFYDFLAQIKAHVDDCHRNVKSGSIEPIRIPCGQCNMSFIQRHNLMRHIEVVHHGKKLYACKHCSKKFQTIADRKKHEKSQHKSVTESPPASPLSTTAATDYTPKPSATHKCLKCPKLLSTYAELRKHVTKKHKEFYHPCGYCNKFCFSKKQLSEHLRQKHEKSAKDNVEKVRSKKKLPVRQTEPTGDKSVPKPTISSAQMSQQNQSQAYFHCSFCFRRFLNYGGLCRHKQIAHRPQVRHCSRLTTDTQMDAEIIEPFSNRNEFEFYGSLAQRVAENLLFYVDGKYIKNYNHSGSDNKVIPMRAITKPDLNLSKYNFPEDFLHQTSPPTSANIEKLEFLFDCNLNTVRNPKFEPIVCETTEELNDSPESATTGETPQKPQYICTACHQKISPELFAEHEVNNHPNVVCTYIEVEPLVNIPSQLLLWQYHCSEGLLHRCPQAPSLTQRKTDDSADSQLSLKCTKCQKSFSSVTLLHNHILECAHNHSSKSKTVATDGPLTHNSADIITSTTSTANTSSGVTTTKMDETVDSLSLSDSLTETNTSLSSNATEKAQEFSSPLSPCKTRSGRRRQISPEDYVKPKRTRNSLKNSSTDDSQSKPKHKSNNSKDSKPETDDIVNKTKDQKLDKEVVNSVKKESSEKTANDGLKANETPVSKAVEMLPKRYSCERCLKKFVYRDSLTKHQMSCKRVFSSKVNKKKFKNLKQNRKIELKAIKAIQKKEEKKKSQKSVKQSPNDSKSCDKSDDNLVTNDETEEEDVTEEDEEHQYIEDIKPDSKSLTLASDTLKTDETVESNVGTDSTDTPTAGLQEHRCSDCLRVFTYTANFRKHIKNVCPVRKQLSNDSTSSNSTPITSTPNHKSSKETSLPEVIVIKEEKSEIEDKDNACIEIIATNDEIVFEGQTPVEPIDAEDEEAIDVTVLPKDESKLDLWRVKQENPQFAFKGSPAQHHSCPYCQRGFTYLANYRKHVKSICPIRQQIDEKKKQVIEDNGDGHDNSDGRVKTELPTLAYTPSSLSVRSQIEDTVLTLLRDQTKQDQILQSSEDMIKSKAMTNTDDSSGQQPNSTDVETNQTTLKNSSTETEMSDESKAQESDKTKDNIKKESTQAMATRAKSSSYKFRTFPCSICHKIFLSYVAMLKHRLSHKLSDGQSANDNNSTNSSNESSGKTSTANEITNDMIESNRDKEAANQALAASILKRSKDVIFSKMRINAANNPSTTTTSVHNTAPKTVEPVIDTSELLETLARGGITTDSIQSLAAKTNPKSKEREVITIETNNNNSNTFNLQLSASTSGANNTGNTNLNNNNISNCNNNGLEEIIIDANHLNDLELNVLKDGVIVAQDLKQLIGVEAEDDPNSKLPVSEVVLNLDDIENANEVWITITDSSAFVEVSNSSNSNSNNNNNNTK